MAINSARSQTDEPLAQSSLHTVAVGVPFLGRVGKLRKLLASISGRFVDRVVIADNSPVLVDGPETFSREYPFDLDVLDLEPDVGIGACRNAIREALDEEYLVVCDSDMELPDELYKLVDILERDDSLGAVSGALCEHGTLRAGICDFHEESPRFAGDLLVQSIREEKELDWSTGYPVARADKLPNAMVVRRECADGVPWDASLKDKEHIDWFVNNWRETDWKMGICPEVIFRHHTGSTLDWYEREYRHGNETRQDIYQEKFCEKWGYDDLVWGDTCWYGTGTRPMVERLYNAVESGLPTGLTYGPKKLAKRMI